MVFWKLLCPIQSIDKNGPLSDSRDDDGVHGPLYTQPGSPWHYPPADLFIRIPFLINFVNTAPFLKTNRRALQQVRAETI